MALLCPLFVLVLMMCGILVFCYYETTRPPEKTWYEKRTTRERVRNTLYWEFLVDCPIDINSPVFKSVHQHFSGDDSCDYCTPGQPCRGKSWVDKQVNARVDELRKATVNDRPNRQDSESD